MAADPLSTAIGAALAVGGAAYGSIASNKWNKKARNLIQSQRDNVEAWRLNRQNQDDINRMESQAIINNQKRLLDEKYRQSEKANIVAGGTDEALALQKASANDALAQTEAAIAKDASNRHDSDERLARAEDAALAQQQVQTYMNQANAAAQAGSQAANAGINLVGVGLQKDNFLKNGIAKNNATTLPDPAKATAQASLDASIAAGIHGPTSGLTL